MSENNELWGKILKFVRRDGPEDAPICFLTIEDGGGFTLEQMNNGEFEKTFAKNGDYIGPVKLYMKEKNKSLSDSIGKTVGMNIIKVMLNLLSEYGHKYDDDEFYGENVLYTKYEQNIKFYPIALDNENSNSYITQIIESKIGRTRQEYKDECKKKRIEMFHEMMQNDKDRIYVICSKGDKEWMEVMKRLFAGEVDFENPEKTEYDAKFYCKKDATLAVVHFGLFRGGKAGKTPSNDNILHLAKKMATLCSDSIKNRLK